MCVCVFLWAKDTWVEINFIFTVFGLVKTEGIGNSPPGGGGGVGGWGWGGWRDKSWRENFVSFLLFGWEWKMGGPVYFPPGTPKLDLSKLEKKRERKLEGIENHYFVPWESLVCYTLCFWWVTKSLSSLHIQVRRIIDQLVRDGKVLNPYLGITLSSVWLLDESDWLFVIDVAANGPAAKAVCTLSWNEFPAWKVSCSFFFKSYEYHWN